MILYNPISCTIVTSGISLDSTTLPLGEVAVEIGRKIVTYGWMMKVKCNMIYYSPKTVPVPEHAGYVCGGRQTVLQLLDV